jgi:hypothetical protein
VPSAEIVERATRTVEIPPLEKLDAPRLPGADFTLPANPLTEMTDDLLSAFIESSLDEAIPTEALAETTAPTPARDSIATMLGMAPLRLTPVLAAPQPVKTELVDRHVAIKDPLPLPAPAPWWQRGIEMARRWWSDRPQWFGIATVAVVVTIGMVTIAWAASSSPSPEPVLAPQTLEPQPLVQGPPTPAPAKPAVVEPTCKVAISTSPSHAIVRVDDKLVGAAPVTVDGPCTSRTVEVSHPRYRTKQVLVTDEPSLHVKLAHR